MFNIFLFKRYPEDTASPRWIVILAGIVAWVELIGVILIKLFG